MRDVQPDVVFEDLGQKAIHAAANRRQKHLDVRALVTVSRRTLDSGNLPAHAFDPRKRFLFFFRNFRKFILHKGALR